MRPTLLAVAMAFLLLSGGGCSPFGITDAGCKSGVIFTLDGLNLDTEYRVSACVGERCEEGALEVGSGLDGTDGPLWLTIGADSDTIFYRLGELELSGQHRASLTVRTGDGEFLVEWQGTVEFVRTQPNGPLCEPTCWLAEITV